MLRTYFIFLLMALLGVRGPAQAPKAVGAEGKVLVAFFSRTGNTRKIAAMIREEAGGDLFEIQTVVPCPADYEAVKAQASREQDGGYRPALKGKVAAFDSYRVIFLGYPVWWARLPPPVAAFLLENSFSGKTIVPFCTHQGSQFGQTLADIRKLCPQARVEEGLAVWGRDADNANAEVSRWLHSAKVQK